MRIYETPGDLRAALAIYMVPEHLWDGLERYLFDRIPTGDYLMAVLRNDFADASLRADGTNMIAAYAIAQWLRNELPPPEAEGSPWGNPENVERWIAR